MKYNNFSVVITTYNRKDFLERAIESILRYANPNFIKEVIVTDDSEEDTTKNYIMKMQEQQKNIVYDRNLKYKKGLLGNRLNGFELATGDIILLLNDDEEIIADFTKEILDFFNKNLDFDILFTDFIRSDNGRYAGSGLVGSGEILYKDLVCRKVKGDFLRVLKKNIFNKNIKFDDRIFGLERIFNHRIYKSHKIYYLKKVFAIYYIGHKSMTSTIEENADGWVRDYKLYIKEYFNEYQKYCPKCISVYYNRKAYLEMILGNGKEAFNDLRRSLIYNKSDFETYFLIISIFLPKKLVIMIKDMYLKLRVLR
jgi:glycosyltransferase involved in cell wall biosynthesis